MAIIHLYQPKCIYCGTLLTIDDSVDLCVESNKYIDYLVGHCPRCDKNYSWKAHYEYEGFSNLTEQN